MPSVSPRVSSPKPLPRVVARLRADADGRLFGARSDRDRDLIRHGYLLALEEVERAAGGDRQ
jgi:hypothetical protein